MADPRFHITSTHSDGLDGAVYLCAGFLNPLDAADALYAVYSGGGHIFSAMAFFGIRDIPRGSCGWGIPSIQFPLFRQSR